jgi:hypothetical protein
MGLGNVDNTSDATKNAAVATLTNKTLTSPVINTPTITGLTSADVGLGNVDNTSDATKNAAVATLSNKTLVAPVLGTPASGDLSNCTAASATAKGVSRLATVAELNAGTDAELTVTPDVLAGSVFGTKNIVVKCILDTSTLTVANGITRLTIPAEMNGMNLVSVGLHIYTASTSGTPTAQIYNETGSCNMLSTLLTIDINEVDSSTAAVAAVIDGACDDIATGTVLRFDCAVAGTGTKGFEVRMGFRLP